MNPLTLSIIGLYKTAVIRRRGSWRTHAGHGVDGSGEIPPELAALTNLQELHLGFNKLSGEIPPELAALTNLQELHLGFNKLSGEIPPELAALTNLEELDLGFNPNLTGTIPRQLLQLRLAILNLMATGVCVPLDDWARYLTQGTAGRSSSSPFLDDPESS